MNHRRPYPAKSVRCQAAPMDDLFDHARRSISATRPFDDEMWYIKIVRYKTGLSRASVYKYMELGLFPRQRHLGPGRVAWRASEVRNWIEMRLE